ncbi:MAG TPA: hypothetical protein VGD31_08545, partial [Sphingobacteriaceae bacterium]
GGYKLVKDFTGFIHDYSALKDELKPFWAALQRIGITPQKFFQLLNLERFLLTDYKPGGRINEILLLFNKPFVDFLISEFAEKSFKNLLELLAEARKDTKILTKWKILNSKNKGLSDPEIDNFMKLPTELFVEFRTKAKSKKGLPDPEVELNKKSEPKIEYLDGALAKFDSKSGRLLIGVVLQLKSPSNVADLLTQLAKTLERLQESDFVSFQKDGKLFKVPSENVYVLADESLGIFYGNIKRSFDLLNVTSEAGDIIKKVDSRPRFTKSDIPEFLRRIKVEYSNPKLTPNSIEKILGIMKAEFLKKSKTR